MKHSLFHMMDIPDHSPKGSFLCLRITSPIPAINTRNVSHLWWCNIFHLHNFLPAKGLFPDQILFNYKIYVSGFLSYNKAVYHSFKIPIALLKQHYVFFMFSGCSFKDNTETTLDNWQSLLEKGPKLVYLTRVWQYTYQISSGSIKSISLFWLLCTLKVSKKITYSHHSNLFHNMGWAQHLSVNCYKRGTVAQQELSCYQQTVEFFLFLLIWFHL